jgi:hypothetical protein
MCLDFFEKRSITDFSFDSALVALIDNRYVRGHDNYDYFNQSLPLVNYYEFHFELQAPLNI